MNVVADIEPIGATADARSATQSAALGWTSTLAERTNGRLREIIQANFNTRYVAQTPSLSAFRDAIFAHGGAAVGDATELLADFRTHVPLSNFDRYEPFMNRFDSQPCKKELVENLFVAGLPVFLVRSSSTTGTSTKFLARYAKGKEILQHGFFDPNSENRLAGIAYCGCMGVKDVVDASGRVVHKIPVYQGTGQAIFKYFGWKPVEESWLSVAAPSYAAPWAATTIIDPRSFLTVHAIFFLSHRDVDRFYTPFATMFVDLIRCIDTQWDTLLGSIRDGILPDLERIDHIRPYLQMHLHADPERAAELLQIGPPSSVEGWVPRVWPKGRMLRTVCTGPWSLLLPKLRFLLGPNVQIVSPGYGTAETMIGFVHDVSKPDEFVLSRDKVVEFLDLSQPETLENLYQPWEVEVGKHYEPILTTKHGLWRYQLGDIVTIVGYHSEKHSPILKFMGRKSMKVQLPHARIADFQMIEALSVISSEDTIVIEEFTAVVDDRTLPPTVGFIVELTKPPGPNAHQARQKLFDALVAIDGEHQRALQAGHIHLPTIRIVEPGTFLEYRIRKVNMLNTNLGQAKVPSVLVDLTAREWILGKVIREL